MLIRSPLIVTLALLALAFCSQDAGAQASEPPPAASPAKCYLLWYASPTEPNDPFVFDRAVRLAPGAQGGEITAPVPIRYTVHYRFRFNIPYSARWQRMQGDTIHLVYGAAHSMTFISLGRVGGDTLRGQEYHMSDSLDPNVRPSADVLAEPFLCGPTPLPGAPPRRAP